ncbi:4'-phosphopantetheinyl transferase sfp [Clostridiales bacterium CHKCI001]|nr:4'-phosphopantetheinyl transferase sfp [Clostridiales bacterium CHKCI001]
MKLFVKTDEFGKPCLEYETSEINVKYNLSHLGKYLVVFFGYEFSLGIDIQEKVKLPDYKDIAKNFFDKDEYEVVCKDKTHNTFYEI